MKKFIQKNKKIIEFILSIISFTLTLLTSDHDMHLIDVIKSLGNPLGCTIYTNVISQNPIFYNIGISAVLEIIVLAFEKRYVNKSNNIIDFLDSLFN